MVLFGFNIVKYIVMFVCVFECGWILVCLVLNSFLVFLIVIDLIILIYLQLL